MSIESAGRSRERPRAQHVIRLHRLPDYLGVSRSMIQDMIDRGLLHPFNLTGRGRSKVVLESEVAQLQADALAKAKVEAESDCDAS
jgi:predicted DNA-binding transcriptional regulator AlpA